MNRNNYDIPSSGTRDYGPNPLIVNIGSFAKQNPYERTTLWTGAQLQVTLMSIPVHGDIGLEVHTDFDQLIRIEDGCGLALVENWALRLHYQQRISPGYALMLPAGTYCKIINEGNIPLKLYAVCAPHPSGTLPTTREAAEGAENA